MKIYTRGGDKGQTSLFGGERVSKAHPRVAAYGTIDELNSLLGVAAALCAREPLVFGAVEQWTQKVQADLFAVGSWLASPEACARVAEGGEAFPGKKRTGIHAARVEELEKDIDGWEAELAPMKNFILPGGGEAGAMLHFARSVCRRAEREVVALRDSGEAVPEIAVQYLNRLNDALFVLARRVNEKQGVREIPWK
ncbi:MAG: cob(I)yrinic acid a,c-diamide adenosyltransferase [Bdellovibrionales bacterium]|nr:cob(I)yrinic acid a,c-diamide adenosyltransferase [Bdellovibrionales bacterium]